jgi:hypothetical protein
MHEIRKTEPRFVVCLKNEDYAASLERHRRASEEVGRLPRQQRILGIAEDLIATPRVDLKSSGFH